MKAAVLHGREDVRIEEVPVPDLQPGDVLLRVEAALTCGTDVKVFRRGYHARMITPPALFGHEVAGTVAEPGTSGLPRGARVVAANSAPCGECEYCRRGASNLCDDLLFWSRIQGAAQAAGVPVRRAAGPPASGPVRRVLVDLSVKSVDPFACAQDWKGAPEPPELIAFGSHVDLEALARARTAGFDRVLTRSAFVRELPALLTLPPGEPAPPGSSPP